MVDILIRKGMVLDGTGAPARRADVAIKGGRIAEIGDLGAAQAPTVLDATGCVVTPGFIDMHSHSDFSLPINPTADSLVHQGITTCVVGQCGLSPAPLFLSTRDQALNSMSLGDIKLHDVSWSGFGSFLKYLSDLHTSVNVVPVVGHGTVRVGVMGWSAQAPTSDEMKCIQAEVGRAMDEGAFGLSTGLVLSPGIWTDTEELIETTRPVGARHGIYFTHVRSEADGLLESIEEEIRIGKETGSAVHHSHYKASGPKNWGLSARGLELIDLARGEGLDITAEMYPYLAGMNSVVDMLPGWVREGGKPAALDRLADPAMRVRMRTDLVAGEARMGLAAWEQKMICGCPSIPRYEGCFITELAAEAGKDPTDWVCDALLETDLRISAAWFGMSEECREQELRTSYMMIGCDGIGVTTSGNLFQGKPHPRFFGTFPRVLGHCVRERKVIPIEEAVYRMCGLPAKRLALHERGVLERGYRADIVVFDPEGIQDLATYEQPLRYPLGIKAVLVNGELVVRDNVHTGRRPGTVIPRS